MSNTNGNVTKLAGGASVALAGRFSGRLISVLGNIIAARILGPALFGIYSIGWTIFRLVELIVPLGFDMGVIRYGAKYLRKHSELFRGLIQRSLRGTFGFSCLIALIFFVTAPWLATEVFNKPELSIVIRFFTVGFPLAGILAVLSATTRLTYDMRYSVLLQDLGQPLVGLILLIIFFFAGARLSGVLLSDLLSYAFVTLLGFYFLARLFPDVYKRIHQNIQDDGFFVYSLFSSLTTITNTLVFWVDRLLVGYFLSASESGIYQAASQISVLFAAILAGFSRIVTPMLASLHHQNLKEEMEEIYRVSTKWGIYLSAPFFLLILLSPNEVLSLTYGSEYTSGALIILILLSGQFFNLITGPVGPLLVATGHQQFTFVISGFALCMNILLNIVLVPRYGLVGAALSTSIALVFLYLIELVAAKRKLDLWPYDYRYWKGFLSAVFAFAFGFLIEDLIVLTPVVSICLQALAVTAGFFGMLLILKLEKEDLELVRLLRSMLLPRKLSKM